MDQALIAGPLFSSGRENGTERHFTGAQTEGERRYLCLDNAKGIRHCKSWLFLSSSGGSILTAACKTSCALEDSLLLALVGPACSAAGRPASLASVIGLYAVSGVNGGGTTWEDTRQGGEPCQDGTLSRTYNTAVLDALGHLPFGILAAGGWRLRAFVAGGARCTGSCCA